MKIYTSSKGEKLTLRPVSQFKIDSLRASKKEIPIPTYRVAVVGGEEQEFPLDETVAKNKGRLDEWSEYLKQKSKADAEHAKKFTDFLIWEGVDIEVPGPDSDWQKGNDHFGISTPDDPIDRKVLYVYNEKLGPAEDIGDLMAEILSVSKLVKEEDVGKLRDSFRPGIQRKADSEMLSPEKSMEDEKPDVQQLGSGALLERQAV